MSPLRPTLSCLALAALGACSEPSYVAQKGDANASAGDAGEAGATPLRTPDGGERASDARTPVEPPLDSATMVDADASLPSEEDSGPSTPVIPAWAEALRGPYASRAFVYRQDEFDTITRGTIVALRHFEQVASGLQLRTKLCLHRAVQPLAELQMVDPTQAPERVEAVVFSESEPRWSSEGGPIQYGFTREPPAICKDKLGEAVPKPPAQQWGQGSTCRCVESVEEPLADDCRVLDPDGDQQPGFTFRLEGLGLLAGTRADVYGGIESDSHYVNGLRREDGTLHANLRAAESNYQFGCAPSDCTNIAKLGRSCAASRNGVELVPLKEAEASCAAILASLGKLFPQPEEAFPTRCFQ